MDPTLYWIPGNWSGQLAIAARPRSGEWLSDELRGFRAAGVDVLVSLLTNEEQADLDLDNEAAECQAAGIDFVSFPIVDRDVPSSQERFADFIGTLNDKLTDGKSIAVHCRMGIGRSAMVAIALLVHAGGDLTTSIQVVSASRGMPVPETSEQRHFLSRFAQIVPALK